MTNRIGWVILLLCVLLGSITYLRFHSGYTGTRTLHASAMTCIPEYTDTSEAFEKLDARMQMLGYSFELPGVRVGWKSKIAATDGGFRLSLDDHCQSGSAGLSLMYIEGSTDSFSLEGWSRWYAVNETFQELLERRVVVERHPWVNTPEDEDVIAFARILDVRLPNNAVRALVERGAASQEELSAIGSCRIIGEPRNYPGC